MITSRYAVALLVARRTGLIAEITDGQPHQVRGPLSYSLAKIGAIHMAEVTAGQMEWQKVPDIMAVAVTPGFLRAEEMLEKVGLAEANGKGVPKSTPTSSHGIPVLGGSTGGAPRGRPRRAPGSWPGVVLMGPHARLWLRGR